VPLEPVYETIARVRQDLPPAVTFLGFFGAPPADVEALKHPLVVGLYATP
jgi:hypothetical protein